MAVDLVERNPEARAVFEKGKEILGADVFAICRDGPESELNSTRISQPAIFLHSMAVLEVLGNQWGISRPFCGGMAAAGTAGLSLGEYSALVFAGSLEFEDALKIVGLRAEFMQEACETSRGTMASVIGLPAQKVEEIVSGTGAQGGAVGVANYNSPDQTVISGEIAAVDEAVERLQAAGARRVIRLKVAGAFHSPLMREATRKLEPFLREVSLRRPAVPFFSNVTGARVEDPEAIRQGLVDQIESPVRWTDIVEGLVRGGVTAALEVGPGSVLRGLVRKVRKNVEVLCVGTCTEVENLENSSVEVKST